MALNGIDISSYQKGIDLTRVPADFVIVKVTQGTGYVNPDANRAVTQALAAGKRVGIYHYVSGAGAQAEADFFYAQSKGWLGRVIWCVDWESGSNKAWGNTSYLDAVVKRLRTLTGAPPLVYASSSAFPWAIASANNCGAWVAQYASNATTGYQATPWNESRYSCAIRQYSSAGRLPGWNGNLDLNKFYGDGADWDKYIAGGASTTATPAATSYNPNGYGADYVRNVQARLASLGYSVGASGADGILGADTYSAVTAYQKDHGLAVDGIPGPDTVASMTAEAAKNAQAATLDVTGIQRAVHVTADNVVGPATRTAVSLVAQASAWGGGKFPNGVAATQRAVGTTADGIWGNGSKAAHDSTVRAIQTALNGLGYSLAVDAIWGQATETAVTDALNRGKQA